MTFQIEDSSSPFDLSSVCMNLGETLRRETNGRLKIKDKPERGGAQKRMRVYSRLEQFDCEPYCGGRRERLMTSIVKVKGRREGRNISATSSESLVLTITRYRDGSFLFFSLEKMKVLGDCFF